MKRADIDHLINMPYKTGWTGIKERDGTRATPGMGAVAGERFDAMNTGDINPAYPRVSAHVVPLSQSGEWAESDLSYAQIHSAGA